MAPRLVRLALSLAIVVVIVGLISWWLGGRGQAAFAPTFDPTGRPTDLATAPPTKSPPSVRVDSIPALLAALSNDDVIEIVVADGTYHVSPASEQAADSLWIGARFAGRRNPVTVRAETPGEVTFDGGGATYFGGLSFEEGAHDQTWEGFQFAHGEATNTGVIVFGGYDGPGPHAITLRAITILASCTGRTVTGGTPELNDHAFYFSQSVGGVHDLTLEDIDVDGSGGLSSALHFFHSAPGRPNASNVTVRRLTVVGTYQPVILWDDTLRDITIDRALITGAVSIAVRYEGGSGIRLSNIVTSGSGVAGFYSSLGTNPPGVSMVNDSFH